MDDVRRFNARGLSEFDRLLYTGDAGPDAPAIAAIISDPELTEPVSPAVSIESRGFSSKMEMAEYLVSKLDLRRPEILHDAGLWSWLSAYYFDVVCPVLHSGKRKPGARHRHILDEDNWARYYRHLVAGPVRMYLFHGDDPDKVRLLLGAAVHKHPDYMEQFAGRQELAANKGVLEAAASLYWDSGKRRPRRGFAPNRHAPGTLRRFVDVVQQLDLTHDLFSMHGPDVLSLLPEEFSLFRARTATSP